MFKLYIEHKECSMYLTIIVVACSKMFSAKCKNHVVNSFAQGALLNSNDSKPCIWCVWVGYFRQYGNRSIIVSWSGHSLVHVHVRSSAAVTQRCPASQESILEQRSRGAFFVAPVKKKLHQTCLPFLTVLTMSLLSLNLYKFTVIHMEQASLRKMGSSTLLLSLDMLSQFPSWCKLWQLY